MIKACGQEIEIFLFLEMSKPKFFLFINVQTIKYYLKKLPYQIVFPPTESFYFYFYF